MVAVVMAEVEWRAWEVSVARTGLDSEVVGSWVRVAGLAGPQRGAAEAVLPRAFQRPS